MGKNRKFRCWACGSLAVITWGKQQGKQRFKCKNCGIFSTRINVSVSKRNREIWFREWVMGKQTFAQLVAKSGYSERILKNYFYDYLEHYPTWNVNRTESVNLLLDGTYFTNKVCLVLYRDNRVKDTVLYRLTDGEWEEELREGLENLIGLGIHIETACFIQLAPYLNTAAAYTKHLT